MYHRQRAGRNGGFLLHGRFVIQYSRTYPNILKKLQQPNRLHWRIWIDRKDPVRSNSRGGHSKGLGILDALQCDNQRLPTQLATPLIFPLVKIAPIDIPLKSLLITMRLMTQPMQNQSPTLATKPSPFQDRLIDVMIAFNVACILTLAMMGTLHRTGHAACCLLVYSLPLLICARMDNDEQLSNPNPLFKKRDDIYSQALVVLIGGFILMLYEMYWMCGITFMVAFVVLFARSVRNTGLKN